VSDLFLQAATDRWREGLVALGFSDDGERLRGPVPWLGPGGSVTARVQITPSEVFPFAPPQVVILDAGAPLEPTFHVDDDGVPCLWEDEWAVDEAPWRDPHRLVDRIAAWMQKTVAGWPGDDSCDLERYLEQDLKTFVLYDAAALVFDAPVRTTAGPTPDSITVTTERRRLGDFGAGRRHRKDMRLAWVADIGAVTRPVRTWSNVADALGPRAEEVARLIGFGVVTLLLLRYTHGGAPGALALRVRQTPTGIALMACESADTSAATRGLRAGPAAPRLADVRIAVVGCGAVGSFAADLLFRSGVRRLTLVDGERLRPGNVVRHLAGVEHLGRHKTTAVYGCLSRVDPNVSGVRLMGPLIELADALDLVREHQVVLDTTGSARASSLLATAAERVGHGSGHTVVSACVQRDGDVLRVDRMPLRRGEVHLPALAPRDGAAGLRERGCGSPVSPTPPTAVVGAAELAVRVVLDEATRECALPATIADVRSPQPEPPYDRLGPITSAEAQQTPRAAVS
jgi:molybdopterin/thiamine biosynthesis adenylyltransferase